MKITASDAARLDPGVRYDVAGAVYFPKDCHLNPKRFVAALQKQLDAAGVEKRRVSRSKYGVKRPKAVVAK